MIMTRHLSNEYEQNLEFYQIQTSASKKVIITVSDLCLFMWQILDRKQLVVVPAAKTTAEPVKQYFLNMLSRSLLVKCLLQVLSYSQEH